MCNKVGYAALRKLIVDGLCPIIPIQVFVMSGIGQHLLCSIQYDVYLNQTVLEYIIAEFRNGHGARKK